MRQKIAAGIFFTYVHIGDYTHKEKTKDHEERKVNEVY